MFVHLRYYLCHTVRAHSHTHTPTRTHAQERESFFSSIGHVQKYIKPCRKFKPKKPVSWWRLNRVKNFHGLSRGPTLFHVVQILDVELVQQSGGKGFLHLCKLQFLSPPYLNTFFPPLPFPSSLSPFSRPLRRSGIDDTHTHTPRTTLSARWVQQTKINQVCTVLLNLIIAPSTY